MEFSVSSMIKLPSSPPHETEKITTKSDDYYEEQSSWTFYFEDFKYKDELVSCDLSSDDCGRPALVSHIEASLGVEKSSRKSFCRNLSVKRRRTHGFFVNTYDEDLEDTATSPVTSPKVSFLNQQSMSLMSCKESNYVNYPKEKANVYGQIVEKTVVFDVGDRDNAELKKRGLCLVPLSMLANIISK